MKNSTTVEAPPSTTPTKHGSRKRATKPKVSDTSPNEVATPAQQAREGVKEIADQAKSKVAETVSSMAEAAREKVAETRDKVSEVTETSKQVAEQKYDDAIDAVRRKPAKSLGLAMGMGVLAGLALASLFIGRKS